jgi:hypothetical protein
MISAFVMILGPVYIETSDPLKSVLLHEGCSSKRCVLKIALQAHY